MSRISWFSFEKLCSWNQHLWSVQSLRRELWFVPLPWELNLRNGMIWWDTYERLRLLVLLVSFKKMILFFVRGRGNRFLRYKKVLTQASSQCNIKITSARAWFYCVVVFVVDPLLICSNIYIYIYVYVYMYMNIKRGKKGRNIIILILLCFNVLSTVSRENGLADFLYMYIYIINCRRYFLGLLGLISAMLTLEWR